MSYLIVSTVIQYSRKKSR